MSTQRAQTTTVAKPRASRLSCSHAPGGGMTPSSGEDPRRRVGGEVRPRDRSRCTRRTTSARPLRLMQVVACRIPARGDPRRGGPPGPHRPARGPIPARQLLPFLSITLFFLTCLLSFLSITLFFLTCLLFFSLPSLLSHLLSFSVFLSVLSVFSVVNIFNSRVQPILNLTDAQQILGRFRPGVRPGEHAHNHDQRHPRPEQPFRHLGRQ